jgi:hypothetical protein
MLFVIVTFSEHHVEKFVTLIKEVPNIGDKLQAIFKEFFNEQKRRLHRNPGDSFAEQVCLYMNSLIERCFRVPQSCNI